MIQAIVSFREVDTRSVLLALNDTSIETNNSEIEPNWKENFLVVKAVGHLHLERRVQRLKDELAGIPIEVGPPQTIFKQPMMKIRVNAVPEFEHIVFNELSKRHPDSSGVVKQNSSMFGHCISFSVRLPLYTLEGIVKQFHDIGGDQITTEMTPDGEDGISSDKLLKRLIRWENS